MDKEKVNDDSVYTAQEIINLDMYDGNRPSVTHESGLCHYASEYMQKRKGVFASTWFFICRKAK
jgi:hypothetical protein